jgi:hypothetical protein
LVLRVASCVTKPEGYRFLDSGTIIPMLHHFKGVQDEILVATEFPADCEKKYMRVSSRARTFPPLTPTLSPLRGEGETGGCFGA